MPTIETIKDYHSHRRFYCWHNLDKRCPYHKYCSKLIKRFGPGIGSENEELMLNIKRLADREEKLEKLLSQ